MASSPTHCPECRARLDSRRAPLGGKVRCPDCGAIVASMRDDDSDDGIQPGRGTVGSAGRGARRPRRDDEDDDLPPRRKGGPSMIGPIVLGSALGLLGLCLIGGGIAGVLWMTAPDAAGGPAPVAEVQAEDAALDPIKPAQGGAGEHGALPLQELKAATVYIKAVTPNVGGATGSGFVVKAVGGAAYVATNHHVIAAIKPEELPPRRGRPGFPRFNQRPGPVQLTAVFRSGTAGEQSLPATVVADDSTDDLAVLKVTGLNDPPRPIDCNHAPELKELMPVVAFGFPFGADLDPDRANPAITVTKGAISSLRYRQRELHEVQVNCEINPGNSGGPLVDESGALVGVVVAKIDKTGTGFAVPVAKLKRLTDGRLAQLDRPEPAPDGARGGEVAGPVNPNPAANPDPPAHPKPPADPARPAPAGPPTGEELTKLLADLKSKDAATRQRAAEALAQAPPKVRLKEVAAAARGLLGDGEAATRLAAVKLLAAADPKEAAPPLAKLIDDPDATVRATVLRLMKELHDPRAAEAVAARLPTEPLAAIDVLKAMGPGAEKAVIPYLDNKYAGPTRFWAFNVIGEIGSAASLPALEAVQGPDTLHAAGVIQAVRQRVPLTKAEWPQALDDLKSADAAKRTAATRRIAATPPVEDRRGDVVSRLETLLNDQSAEARVAAVKGLGRWGGKKTIPALAARLQSFDPTLHAAVIDTLAEFKDDEAAAAIAKRLPDVFDRPRATQALKAMDAPVAEKAILPLLKDTNVFVRVEAVKVLADVGGRDSVAPLEQLAADNNIFYSGPAAQALAAVKARAAEK